ncbi:TetR/AcrR family transcriptional regulator [Roseibium sp. M-1]
MPKQIDHDAYRLELARKAAPLFSEHGYSGLGMRRVAEEIGLSKSALYHYFPTKKSLFLACTETVMSAMQASDEEQEENKTAAAALIDFAKDLEPGFASEMSLLFDYLRGKTREEIAADPAMRLANDHLLQQVGKLTGPDHAQSVLCMLMGALLMRYFTGGTLQLDALAPALERLR